jgi:hypothetical protein
VFYEVGSEDNDDYELRLTTEGTNEYIGDRLTEGIGATGDQEDI